MKYYPKGVCSKEINFEVIDGIITECSFVGGCPGNLLGISKLVIGMSVDKVISLFEENKCGSRDTSCPQQLALALKEYQSVL